MKFECIFSSALYDQGAFKDYAVQWDGMLKKCKQFFEFPQLLILRDIWWSKFKFIFKY
jgi:hypothetical protein